MYYPYLALFWNPENSVQCDFARILIRRVDSSRMSWIPHTAVPGSAVFGTAASPHPMAAYPLPAARGLVFGKLFHRGTSVPVPPESLSFDSAFHTLGPEAIGKHLVSHYWGAYVCFAADMRTLDWVAIRDCSGMIPCYFTTLCGVSVFFAEIRHLLELHDSLQINWRYLTAFLSWSHLQIRETALKGVQELLAGEMVIGSPEKRKTVFAWDPVTVCLSDPLLDEEIAGRELLEATQCSVGGWSSAQRNLVHSLSGGFDSAVVLGAMMQTERPPEVVCVNRYGDAPGEDERRFARLAAGQHGVLLLEFGWNSSIQELDERLLAIPVAAKPAVPHILGLLETLFWNTLCTQLGCDSITTGQGGDHLFVSSRTALGVADCIGFHRMRGRFREALRDVAFLTGQSFLHVLTSAASAKLGSKRVLQHAGYMPKAALLSEDAIFPELPHYILPPWCAASQALPPGKRYQVLQLSDVVNRHRPLGGLRLKEELHPLLSQPLLEVALRIPLHLLQTGGKTRGLARDAFRHLVPAPIISRELKGHTSAFILGLINRNLPFVRQLLLQGSLVERRVLVPNILERYLTPTEPLRAEIIFPLLAAISAELWLRSWLMRARNPAPELNHPFSTGAIAYSAAVAAPSSPASPASRATHCSHPKG